MLDQIFGTELPLAARFLIAFVVVLALIVLVAWVVRSLAWGRTTPKTPYRPRQTRLGVVDAYSVDGRRRLVLVRRDNIEHLVMIGGPNDVLLESRIVRQPARETALAAPAMPAPAAMPGMPAAARAPAEPTPRVGPPAAPAPRPAPAPAAPRPQPAAPADRPPPAYLRRALEEPVPVPPKGPAAKEPAAGAEPAA
ncbi:MAG TPA: flagellar biosynthesis protein FliO, partial [Hyphomicrobiales bacterium]|nr:flagellar biosynthesis protein FliO [Hyphomicrobiales bacterium]